MAAGAELLSPEELPPEELLPEELPPEELSPLGLEVSGVGSVSVFQSQVTLQVAERGFPLASVMLDCSTVMVALPGATAVILPWLSTLTTDPSLEVKVGTVFTTGSTVHFSWKVAPALFRVMLVRFRVRVAEGRGSMSPALPSGWEPSEEEALPPAEPLPLGSEPSGWLELEPPPELPPGSEEEAQIGRASCRKEC